MKGIGWSWGTIQLEALGAAAHSRTRLQGAAVECEFLSGTLWDTPARLSEARWGFSWIALCRAGCHQGEAEKMGWDQF